MSPCPVLPHTLYNLMSTNTFEDNSTYKFWALVDVPHKRKASSVSSEYRDTSVVIWYERVVHKVIKVWCFDICKWYRQKQRRLACEYYKELVVDWQGQFSHVQLWLISLVPIYHTVLFLYFCLFKNSLVAACCLCPLIFLEQSNYI